MPPTVHPDPWIANGLREPAAEAARLWRLLQRVQELAELGTADVTHRWHALRPTALAALADLRALALERLE